MSRRSRLLVSIVPPCDLRLMRSSDFRGTGGRQRQRCAQWVAASVAGATPCPPPCRFLGSRSWRGRSALYPTGVAGQLTSVDTNEWSRTVGPGARRRVDRSDRASGSVAPDVVALARIPVAPQRRSSLTASQALVLPVSGRLAPWRQAVVGASVVARRRGSPLSGPSHPVLGTVSSVPCAPGRGRRDRSFRLLPQVLPLARARRSSSFQPVGGLSAGSPCSLGVVDRARRRSHAVVATALGAVGGFPQLLGPVVPLSHSVRRPDGTVPRPTSPCRVELDRGLDEREATAAPRFLPRRVHAAWRRSASGRRFPFARAGPASSSSVGRCSSALASDSIRDVTSLSASAAA